MLFAIFLTLVLIIIFFRKSKNNVNSAQVFIPKNCHNGNIDLVLEQVPMNKKIIALKELRTILDLDLATCKYVVDSATITILRNISEEQVQYLQEKFKYIGVNVTFKNNFS